MDDIALVSLALIVAVPALFAAARIWKDPFAGLVLWVILLPVSKSMASLVGYPPDEGPEVLRKLTLSDPVLALTAAAILLNPRVRLGELSVDGRRVVLLLGLFCVLGIVSAIVGEAGPEAFIELATYAWLGITVVVVCRLLGDRARADQALAAFKRSAIVACTAGVAGILLIFKGANDNLLVRGDRVTGLFEGPKQVESFMVVVIPFLCVAVIHPRSSRTMRFGYAALILAAAASVLASGSRLGVVLAVLAIGIMLLSASPRVAIVSALVVFLAAGSAWRWYDAHRAEVPFGVQRALSFLDEDRFDLEKLSHGRADQLSTWYVVFAEHPLFGVGLDQFRGNVPRFVAGGKAQEMHNSYLGVLAEGGLFGAAAMFTLLALVLVRSAFSLRSALREGASHEALEGLALLVSYTSLLLYGMNQYGLRQRYFWFVVALVLSLPRLAASRRKVPSPTLDAAPVPADRFAPRWSPQAS